MSIKLLNSLAAIHQTGSFTEAAERVFVSKAAIGQQMKQLEELVEIELFDRSDRIPVLNSQAKALIPAIEEVILSYNNLISTAKVEQEFSGNITVGTVPSALLGLVPKTIRKLISESNNLLIRVIPGISDDLHDHLRNGTIDAAILTKPNFIDKSLEWSPIYKEELVLLTSSRILEDDPIEILKNEPYLRLPRRTSVGSIADNWLVKNRVKYNESMVLDTMESLTHMVFHDVGVSIAPNLRIGSLEYENLRKIPLGGGEWYRELGLLTVKNSVHSAITDKLFDYIVKVSSAKNIL